MLSKMKAALELKHFQDWCVSKNILISDAIRVDRRWDDVAKRYNLCIVTNRTILSDEDVIQIPKKVCLGAKTCTISGEIRQAKLAGGLALNFAIAHEISLGKLSPWSAYLGILPLDGERSLPMYWSSKMRALLQGTSLDAHTIADDSALSDDFEEGCALLNNLLPQESQIIDLNIYKVAASIAASRSFFVDEVYGECLVPVADFFNHKTKRQGVRVYDQDSNNAFNKRQFSMPGTLVVKSVKKLKKDEEVFNTFGLQSNASLLYNYGFCETDNKYYGSVFIPKTIVHRVLTDFSFRSRLMNACNLNFEVSTSGNVSKDLVQYITKKISQQNNFEGRYSSSKQLLFRILIDILESRKSLYRKSKKSSLKQDYHCLNSSCIGAAAACIIRNEELHILEEAISKIENKLIKLKRRERSCYC
jgi:hypothetical protein